MRFLPKNSFSRRKEKPSVRTPQSEDNHGLIKVRFVEKITDIVVKPSSS